MRPVSTLNALSGRKTTDAAATAPARITRPIRIALRIGRHLSASRRNLIGRFDYLPLEPPPNAEPRLGRRTALTFPVPPPPQKNRSPPSDSSPETFTPGGISSNSRTSPVRGSTRLKSLSSPSQVACQSSPSIQVTPVTKRLDSIVRRIAPVSGSI